MKNNTYITIMAGGVGSRFWPASREDMPKQFLDILGVGKSLIRQTFERFLSIVPAENILILTNEKYTGLVNEHLPEILDKNILCEPSMNNTAPAIAYAALRIQRENPDATFVVAPSDHVILKEQIFLDKIKKAIHFAKENQALLTLGIQPTRPDTGYGYIELACSCDCGCDEECDCGCEHDGKGVCKVKAFREKPDLDTANKYLADGNYLWNAGIFIWTVKDILASFQQHTKGIIDVLNQMPDYLGSKNEQEYINKVYPQTTKISIDYAILENANNVFTIPADIGWSDLGTWNSLYSYLEKDDNGNVIDANKSKIIDSKNNFIRMPKNKLLVAKGMEDFIIIDEGDVLLIYPKSLEQEIKQVRQEALKLK